MWCLSRGHAGGGGGRGRARRRRAATLLLVAPWLATLSCADAGERLADREVRGDQTPRRIVSLIPSATETILALGAGDRFVARTDYDTDPSLVRLPTVGGGLTPSLEQLTMLELDLVVAWPDNDVRSITARLTDLGVEVYSPEVQTLADVYDTAGELGRLLGLETAADSLTSSLQAEVEAVRRAVAGRERPEVFYVVWHDPPTTAGPGTYIDELIEIAGGLNIFADAPALWPQVSLEEIIRRQPDIVILPAGEERTLGLEQLASTVGWRDLRAVREGRVAQVDADLFNRPGPRVAEAARRLARLLHPDAFGDAGSP